MKFSYQWLSSLVDGLSASDPRDVMRLITMKTAECEAIEEAGPLMHGACAALVISVTPITDSNNQVALVKTAYGEKTVVCGAPNCRPDLWTIYVPLGTKLIAGVESDGMLASGAELGINRDHAGIVELNGSAFAFTPDH